MDVVFTNAGEFGRDKKSRYVNVEKTEVSSLETARRTLIKELRKIDIDHSEAIIYANRFGDKQNIRTLYMPLLAVVINEFHHRPNRSFETILDEIKDHIDATILPLVLGNKKSGKALSEKEKSNLTKKLKSRFIAYARLVSTVFYNE